MASDGHDGSIFHAPDTEPQQWLVSAMDEQGEEGDTVYELRVDPDAGLELWEAQDSGEKQGVATYPLSCITAVDMTANNKKGIRFQVTGDLATRVSAPALVADDVEGSVPALVWALRLVLGANAGDAVGGVALKFASQWETMFTPRPWAKGVLPTTETDARLLRPRRGEWTPSQDEWSEWLEQLQTETVPQAFEQCEERRSPAVRQYWRKQRSYQAAAAVASLVMFAVAYVLTVQMQWHPIPFVVAFPMAGAVLLFAYAVVGFFLPAEQVQAALTEEFVEHANASRLLTEHHMHLEVDHTEHGVHNTTLVLLAPGVRRSGTA